MSKPTVIGITGGSGSGKTLFMQKLVEKLPAVAVHSMDNYYIEMELQPKDEQGVENFDRLDSIDVEKFQKDLELLMAGESLQLEEYNYNNPREDRKKITIKSEKIILVEGIFALYLEGIRPYLDLGIYIEAPEYLMVKRRILRDAKERGYDMDDVLYRFEHHVIPAFQEYIEPSKRWADIIIPNHENFDKALDVIVAFLNR